MADVCSWRTQKKTKSDCVYPFSKIVCDHIKFTHKPETPNNSEGQSKQQARQKPPVTSNIWIYIYSRLIMFDLSKPTHTLVYILYRYIYIYYIIHNYTHTHTSSQQNVQLSPGPAGPAGAQEFIRDVYQTFVEIDTKETGFMSFEGFEWDGEKKQLESWRPVVR